MRVTILHPDLGIGGAERLIIDAALALKKKGHEVRVVTNHFDPAHAFKDTENLNITVIQWFPRVIFGYMWALCAYIRMCLAAIYVCMYMENDVIICDQVSAALVVLRLFSRSRLVFYCHFPDLLLTTRNSVLKSFYRRFLDAIEEYSTGLAHVICVNSLFTASVVKETFSTLQNREMTVLYPTLNTEFFDETKEGEISSILLSPEHIFTSLNRFEVKKNLKLALEAFAELRIMLSEEEFSSCHLVVAGGYDRLNLENITHFKELVDFADVLGLKRSQVTFLRSPTDEEKISLLRNSRAVLYTPHNEHFGIVPIESMYLGTPVIAVDSGGPRESIVHGETGFLAKQTPQEFAMYMLTLIRDENLRLKMSEMSQKRVREFFCFDAFADRFDRIIRGEGH